ncbi:MAG: ribonuclease P protein component [Flavobacteriaceae bacterium]|nr:ribonuclease P protein component [Flavobacteriaceae bacterium]
MKINGYPKTEKLKNKTEISLLFEKGKWFSYKDLQVISLVKEDLENQKVGVSVSKRYFKKAVDRNRIKRLLREVYRLNKKRFVETFGQNSLTMIFYKSSQKPTKFSKVEEMFIELCNNVEASLK